MLLQNLCHISEVYVSGSPVEGIHSEVLHTHFKGQRELLFGGHRNEPQVLSDLLFHGMRLPICLLRQSSLGAFHLVLYKILQEEPSHFVELSDGQESFAEMIHKDCSNDKRRLSALFQRLFHPFQGQGRFDGRFHDLGCSSVGLSFILHHKGGFFACLEEQCSRESDLAVIGSVVASFELIHELKVIGLV